MNRICWIVTMLSIALLFNLCATPLTAADNEEGFVPMFNGKDLSGWKMINIAPSTFTVKDGMVICSGKPIGELRTEKMYENFIMELEWRHMKPKGNAGVFVWADDITAQGQPFHRGIEVQVLENAYGNSKGHTVHGDIFPIHGAKMTPINGRGGSRAFPTENRSKPSPEWNHYRITCIDGTISLAVNGKVVTRGKNCQPRKGYICLESEGGIVHYKNVRIKELPPSKTPLKPADIAKADVGFRSLYNGVDLTGWKVDPKNEGNWQVRDWVLNYNGKGTHLWTAEEFEDFELIVDWRWPVNKNNKPKTVQRQVILPSGDFAVGDDGKPRTQQVDEMGDSGIYLRGSAKYQVNIWCWPAGSGEMWGIRGDKNLPAKVRAGAVPKVKADRKLGQWNRFHITCKGDHVKVLLNGKLVIDNVIPNMKAKGPIALQHHGNPIQFANIYVRELKK